MTDEERSEFLRQFQESFFNAVRKDQMADFLGIESFKKLKKAELITMLQAKFQEDDFAKRRFYKDFRQELAVSPYAVEQLLNCTPTERKRWTMEKILPVVEYRSFTYGKYPVYERWSIEHDFSQEKLAKLREEHELEVAKHRAQATKKANKTKRTNIAKRKVFEQEMKKQIRDWNKRGLELGATLELAFWTMWASRWAKANELRARHARIETKKVSYTAKKEQWYVEKDEAMRVLASSPYTKLSFYRPEYADKFNLFFCDKHYQEFRYLRDMGVYQNTFEAYEVEPKKYNKCPDCVTTYERNYYSLYYLEIATDEYNFSFHVPYPIGKEFLPDYKKLPKVEQEENDEGVFRFGRPILKEEMVTHSEAVVEKNFQKALAKAKKYLGNR